MNISEIVNAPLFKEMPATAFKIYAYFITSGRKGSWFKKTIEQIEEDTGISKRSIYRSLELLKQSEIIEVSKQDKKSNKYRIVSD